MAARSPRPPGRSAGTRARAVRPAGRRPEPAHGPRRPPGRGDRRRAAGGGRRARLRLRRPLRRVGRTRRLLGLALGLALACLAAALVVAGTARRPAGDGGGGTAARSATTPSPSARRPTSSREGPRASRAGACCSAPRAWPRPASGAAGVVPAASLGPRVGDKIDDTPWRRGRGVVDDQGEPILADDVTPGAFVTGFPDGADTRELGSPIVMVRAAARGPPPARRARPGAVGAGGDPRLLEDLHARGLRDRRSTATRSTPRSSRARRSCARAITPRSTRRGAPSGSSARPAVRCPSSRSRSIRSAAGCAPAAGSRARSGRPGGG